MFRGFAFVIIKAVLCVPCRYVGLSGLSRRNIAFELEEAFVQLSSVESAVIDIKRHAFERPVCIVDYEKALL